MIQFTTPDRLAIVCDSCSKPIAQPAEAVAVRWGSRTALVVHDGACLDLLRLQYPSTLRQPVLPLAGVMEQFTGAEVEATGRSEGQSMNDADPLAAIRARWIAECRTPGFRIFAEPAVAPAELPGAEVSCCLRHDPEPDGKDGRGWTRYVCRDCGRFYGYAPPSEHGATHKASSGRLPTKEAAK